MRFPAAGALIVVTAIVAAAPVHAAGPQPYTAFTTMAAGSLMPVNAMTQALGTPLPVGTTAYAVAITPDAATAYVADYVAGTVTPVTLATGAAGTPIAAGATPWAVAITPDGSKAYVTNYSGSTVTPIAIPANTPGAPISVGGSPTGVAFTPDGATAYVASYTGGTVTPITVATGNPRAAIHVGSGPTGVAVTSDGTRVYVANQAGGSVTPVTVATGTAGTAITVGGAPTGIAITPDGGRAYVTNFSGASVIPITLATGAASSAIPVAAQPRGVAVTPDGARVEVASESGGALTAIDVATGASAGVAAIAGATGVAITPDQAPVASFTTTTAAAGEPTAFDASASTVRFGSIASYAWTFGDGQTATTTGPTTTHAYAAAGAYTASVTETDAAGTALAGTTRFTGQTMSRHGGPSATTSRAVTVEPPLGWAAPPSGVSFAATLNGRDQRVRAALPLAITSGATRGWNVTATSTTFTAPGGATLPLDAVTVPDVPAHTCATTCTPATATVDYPYALPAGPEEPAATKLVNATPGTGDSQTVTPTFELAIPARARAGIYTSTWTLSLQSGP